MALISPSLVPATGAPTLLQAPPSDVAACTGLVGLKPGSGVIPTPTSWNGSFLDTDTTKSGVVFNTVNSRLELQRNGQQFNTKALTATSDTVYVATADFDKDGWIDFVGIPQATTLTTTSTAVSLFKNFTFQNENCTDATCAVHAGSA